VAATSNVILAVRCAHCGGAVSLECEGLPGFWGYRTYNEYFCPHCRKQNHALSSGAVVAAHAAWNGHPETSPDRTLGRHG
jgi:hypothetical protein